MNTWTFFNLNDDSLPNLDGFNRPEDMAEFRSECEQLESGLALLRSYAEAKEAAMRLRIAGRIEKARRFEAAADTVYEQLPKWAKW